MFAKKLSCSTKPVENVTTSNDYQYSNFDLNRQRILCNDLISFVSSPPMAFNKKRNCYGNVANDCHKESKLDLNWKNKGTKAKTFMNGALGDKNGEKRWKNEKDSSLKKSSTLSIHIKAYENAIEASIVIEEKLAEAKAKKDSWKSIAKRVLPDSLADDSFEYPRQQTDKISEPQIMQFTASQTLFNPNASVGTSSSNVTPAASQRDTSVISHDRPHLPAEATQEGYANDTNGNVPTSAFGGFDLSKLEVSAEFAKKFDSTGVESALMNQVSEQAIVEKQFDLSKYANIPSFLASASTPQIACMYNNFLETLPDHLRVTVLADVLLKPCCAECCCYHFSPECIMRERIKIPAVCATKQSIHYAILQYHFYLLQRYLLDGKFFLEIGGTSVCQDFFCHVHLISENRFAKLCHQLLMGFKQAVPHGNSLVRFERQETLQRLAKLVSSLHRTAEPHPSGSGYFGASLTSKVRIMKDAGVYKPGSTSHLFKKIEATVHVQKENTFTKCETCINLRLLIENDRLPLATRNQARQHLDNHVKNIHDDRKIYAITGNKSVETNDIILLAHDGVSKELTKFPHLLENNGKRLNDALKQMCSLNAAIIHKKWEQYNRRVILYWNPTQMLPANANATVSQLLHAISSCEIIPHQIAIQLDNCPVNKNYTVLAAFACLLLWVPELTKVFICTNEVGHTHNDVDQLFGVLSKALAQKEVYSPQGLVKFAEETLKPVVGNHLIPATYDFESLLRPICNQHGKINANHHFELSKDANGQAVVKIARFIRASEFVVKNSEEDDAFPVFKEQPNLDKFPALIPRPKLDLEKHDKLCSAATRIIPPSGWQELIDLPQLIEEFPPSEEFEVLLNRIRANIIPSAEKPVPISSDPNNEQLDAFRKSDDVSKVWLKPQSLLSSSQSVPSGKRMVPPPPEETPPTRKSKNSLQSNPQPVKRQKTAKDPSVPPARRGRPLKAATNK